MRQLPWAGGRQRDSCASGGGGPERPQSIAPLGIQPLAEGGMPPGPPALRREEGPQVPQPQAITTSAARELTRLL